MISSELDEILATDRAEASRLAFAAVLAELEALAAELGPVVVAAGDREIVATVESAGGNAVLTDPALPSGSDRIHAALEALDPSGRHDVAVNLQGWPVQAVPVPHVTGT